MNTYIELTEQHIPTHFMATMEQLAGLALSFFVFLTSLETTHSNQRKHHT
jgi:hypothetical protein